MSNNVSFFKTFGFKNWNFFCHFIVCLAGLPSQTAGFDRCFPLDLPRHDISINLYPNFSLSKSSNNLDHADTADADADDSDGSAAADDAHADDDDDFPEQS